MIPRMTPSELEAIERRAEMCFIHGDPAALRREDVTALTDEVHALWALRRTLIAHARQGLGWIDGNQDAAINDTAGSRA